ncbi:MAG TPA: hypothetical protein DCS67_02285 [Clostridiales bacterium UBA8960]|nr:hypothetical protein [Clostridiales bacterium UBA8960]
MKKTIIAIILLLLGSVITYVEIERIERSKNNDSVSVVVAKNDMKIGDVIQTKDLAMNMIPKDLKTMIYYSDVGELIGKSLRIDLSKDVIINEHMVKGEPFHDPGNGNAITAIKMLPEEILCWEVALGDAVSIISVSQEGNLYEIGQVIVKGVYYQNGNNESKYDNAPVYLLVEGTKEQIKTIIKHRKNGKIEGVKMGS